MYRSQENTYVVVDALIKANKDFDLLMIPNAGAQINPRLTRTRKMPPKHSGNMVANPE